MTDQEVSSFDAALLAAESDTIPMHSLVVLMLDPSTIPGGYAYEALRNRIGTALLSWPKLRTRLVETPFQLARPYWVDSPDPDLAVHIRRTATARPGGPRELSAIAARLNERRMNRRRPLFEVIVVEGLRSGSIAVLFKLHPLVLQDAAATDILTSLATKDPEFSEAPVRRPLRPPSDHVDAPLIVDALPALLSGSLDVVRAGRDAFRSALRATIVEDHSAEPSPAPPIRTPLDGRTSTARSAAYASLRMASVGSIARVFSLRAGEVVLGVVAGALRIHWLMRGELPDGPLLAGIKTHPGDFDGETEVSAARHPVRLATLATNMEDPVERLRAVRGPGTRIGPHGMGGLDDILTRLAELPSPAPLALLSSIARGLNFSEPIPPPYHVAFTDLTGADEARYLGGARIHNVYLFEPLYEGINLHITAIRMGASIDIGLSACPRREPDVWDLTSHLSDSLAELLDAAAAEELKQHAAPLG